MDAAEFGRFLIEARLARDLTLDEVARQTHIRKEILAALEHGDLGRAPVSVLQLRGMLRNYVRFLRQDSEQALAWFDDLVGLSAASDPLEAKKMVGSTDADTRGGSHSGVRRWRILIVIVLLLLLGSLLTIVTLSTFFRERNTAEQNLLVDADELMVTPSEEMLSPTPIMLLVATAEESNQEGVLTGLEGFTVTVKTKQRGWLKITVDGSVVYDGFSLAGEELSYEAETELRLESANAAGIQVEYMGETFSDIGVRGQWLELVFQIHEVQMELGSGSEATETLTAAPSLTTSPVVSGDSVSATEMAPVIPTTANRNTNEPTVETEVHPLVTPPPTLTAIATHTVIPATNTATAILPPRTPMGPEVEGGQ